MDRMTMEIGGMSCGHCVRAVRAALEDVPGVRVERVEIGSAEVAYDAGQASPQRIRDAVREEGYPVREPGREP